MAASSSSVVSAVSEASETLLPDSAAEENKDTTINESLLEGQSLESMEGKRIKTFCQGLKKTVNKVISAGRPEKFNSMFKRTCVQNPEAFSSITEQLMEHLKTNIETEVKLMIKQEDLVNLFNELDSIRESHQTSVGEACTGPEQAWRPSGVPSADCRDHVMQVKLAYQDQLRRMLEQIEKENELLKEVVVPQRERVILKEKELNERTKSFDEAIELISQSFDVTKYQEQALQMANT